MSAKRYTLVNFINAIINAAINFLMPAFIGVENSSQLQILRRNVTTFSPILDLGNSYEVARCGWRSLNVNILALSIVISLLPAIGLLNEMRLTQEESSDLHLILCGLLTVIIYNCIAVNVAQKKLVRSAWINIVATVAPTIVAIAIYKMQADGLLGYVVTLLIVTILILSISCSVIRVGGSGSLLDNIKFGLPKAISGALETAYLLPIINAAIYHEWAYKIVFFSQIGRFLGGLINSNLVYARVSELGLSNKDLINFGLVIGAGGCVFFGASFALPVAFDFKYYSVQSLNESVFFALVMFGSMLSLAVSGYLNLKIKMPLLGALNSMTLLLVFIALKFEILAVEWLLCVHVLMLLVIVYRIFKNERI